jgi:hypothetical protein
LATSARGGPPPPRNASGFANIVTAICLDLRKIYSLWWFAHTSSIRRKMFDPKREFFSRVRQLYQLICILRPIRIYTFSSWPIRSRSRTLFQTSKVTTVFVYTVLQIPAVNTFYLLITKFHIFHK